MGELALPGLALPASPGILLPDARLLIPAASRILRQPLKRWRARTARDLLVPAVTTDQATLGTGNAAGSTTTTMSTSATVASGAHIIVVVGRFASGGTGVTVSMSGGGLTWTQDHTLASGNLRTSVFRAPAPAGLASGTTLTATHSASADCIMGAASYLGIDTVGTVTAINAAAASTAAWSSGSVAGNSGDALIGGAFTDSAVVSSTPGGAANERIDTNIAGQSETLVLEDILSIAGSTALTGTWNTAGTHIATAVSYKAAAGASTKAPPFQSRTVRNMMLRR